MGITPNQRLDAIGKDSRDYACSINMYDDHVCHPFCYMTEMMAQGWQRCPNLSIKKKELMS